MATMSEIPTAAIIADPRDVATWGEAPPQKTRAERQAEAKAAKAAEDQAADLAARRAREAALPAEVRAVQAALAKYSTGERVKQLDARVREYARHAERLQEELEATRAKAGFEGPPAVVAAALLDGKTSLSDRRAWRERVTGLEAEFAEVQHALRILDQVRDLVVYEERLAAMPAKVKTHFKDLDKLRAALEAFKVAVLAVQPSAQDLRNAWVDLSQRADHLLAAGQAPRGLPVSSDVFDLANAWLEDVQAADLGNRSKFDAWMQLFEVQRRKYGQ